MVKESEFEKLTKNIDWNRVVLTAIPLLQPFLIFGAWLGACKFYNRADAVAKLIAIAEPIPTIDLNLPRPVVLASLYHSTDEALDVLKDVIDFLQDIDIPSADEIIDNAKEEIEEFVDEKTGEGITDSAQFLRDYNACKKNAKDTLGIAYNRFTGATWIISCLVQKGYTRGIVEEWVKIKLGV
jgi:hypothetical protein